MATTFQNALEACASAPWNCAASSTDPETRIVSKPKTVSPRCATMNGLSARASSFRHYEEARREFAAISRQAARAATLLPSHRDLISQVYQRGFARPQAR